MRISVICELHRSGTTFVGEILRHAGANIIHEPLNEEFGMINVPISYPYVEETSDALSGLIDDAFNMARPWSRDYSSSVPIWKERGTRLIWLRHLVYSITGGKNGLRWWWLRLRRGVRMPPKSIFFKDPYLTFSTPYIASTYDSKIACMVRHPAAVFYSSENQHWRFNIENLLGQSNLVAKYGYGITEDHWNLARTSNAASIAILWKLMIRINLSAAAKDNRILVITHELLCVDPQTFAQDICRHFEVPFTTSLEQYVTAHTGGVRVEAEGGKLHDFTRNSSALADLWRRKVSPEDQKIIDEIARDELQQIYGDVEHAQA